jgi:tetratricopeptide (TPR) repeat protein
VSQSRIEQFQAFLDQDPNNSFARYVIAQEHAKADNLEGAMDAYRELLSRDPDYVAAYHHGGKTLERLDQMDAASELYKQGIEVANRVGNGHARAELEEALAGIS